MRGRIRYAAAVLFSLSLLAASPAEAQTTTKPPKITLEKILKLEDSPGTVAWSPDGKLLATSDSLNRRIIIWDYATGEKHHQLLRNVFGRGPLIFTPDGKQIIAGTVTASSINNLVSLSLIDVASGKVLRDIPGNFRTPKYVTSNVPRTLAMSKKGDIVATITDDGIFHHLSFYKTNNWGLTSTQILGGPDVPRISATDIAFNPETNDLAIMGIAGDLEVWDSTSGRRTKDFKAFSNSGRALAFSADGKFLATSGATGTSREPHDRDPLRLWDTKTWTMIASATSSEQHDFRSWSLSFSPTLPYLASFHADGKILLWDARTLTPIMEINDGGGIGGVGAFFSPDGRRLAIVRNFEVRVVRIENE